MPYAFYVGAAAEALAVGWTVISTREYSPEQLASFEEPCAAQEVIELHQNSATQLFGLAKVVPWLIGGGFANLSIYLGDWDYQLYLLSIGAMVIGGLLVCAYQGERRQSNSGFMQACRSFVLMPETMRRLALVQFFWWLPLFAMWIYTTPIVAEVFYGSSDTPTAAYNEGANWVGVLFGAYNGVSIFAALLIPVLVPLFCYVYIAY